ncbi:pilus assembly protein [Endozoicomonas sp. G2_2]|uniref:TadE/TadG family type IV pilus assembly protein n=1 Tax=Endozoicomonas sp. G2_2 TaxID=2821092 RepID=UPI001ADB8031|nr:TadE/TadG family type IV pilus assembly protein [Endozoicomonas sp. G2_2]MBO9469452.1 pilus assembly protein [Endozoicomonas sp. G2_2]
MMQATQRGASLIEFALVLPLFLLLVIGILTYGIAFATHQAVNYAAQRSAESVTHLDPELDMAAYAARATGLVNERLASVLGYFPGDAPSVAAAENGCDTAEDSESAAPARLCIDTDADVPGRRVIVVELAPTFDSLWPGFPQTGYIPALGPIRATGRSVVAAGNGGS